MGRGNPGGLSLEAYVLAKSVDMPAKEKLLWAQPSFTEDGQYVGLMVRLCIWQEEAN